MSTTFEPNPPTRKPGGFPKTTTFPEGWVMDEITANSAASRDAVTGEPVFDALAAPVPATGRTNGKVHPEESESAAEESPFARQLEPFPSQVDLRGSWL